MPSARSFSLTNKHSGVVCVAFVQCGLRYSGTVEGRQNAISGVSWFVLDTSTSQSQSSNGHTLDSFVECQLYRVDREQATYLSSSASELCRNVAYAPYIILGFS